MSKCIYEVYVGVYTYNIQGMSLRVRQYIRYKYILTPMHIYYIYIKYTYRHTIHTQQVNTYTAIYIRIQVVYTYSSILTAHSRTDGHCSSNQL